MMNQTQDPAGHATPRRRSAGLRFFLIAIGSLLTAGFFALGTWQLYRLQWKLALIERVEQRVHAAAAEAPGAADWPRVSAESDEYRHVSLTGVYLMDQTARVQASTELGSGFWLLTPMCRNDGSIVLVNRGFVAGGSPDSLPRPAAPSCEAARGQGAATTVTGLLRISETKGGFLRDNDPAADRWYSRDVEAISASRQLSKVAPYFVDADAAQGAAGAGAAGASNADGAAADAPVGGLTVISFHNNHLVYAFTWYVLALMVAFAAYWVGRDERRRKSRGDD